MKKILALNARHLKLLLIALPFVVAAIYLFLIASNRYVSESIMTVRAGNQDQGSVPGIAVLLGGVNPPSRDDALYLRQYVHSLDLLKKLDEKLDLRAHYSQDSPDLLYRLSPKADQERFLDYYRNRVEVVFDDVSSLLTIRAQGFEPKFAHQLNSAILAECEQFVNAFSQRMARQQMAFAEGELRLASQRLQEAKAKVLSFQAQNKLLDPLAQMQANTALTAELQASLSRQEAELRNARSYLNEDSYQVRALRGQIESTRAQLDLERTRATSGQGNDRINTLAARFQDLQVQVLFAQDAYRVSLTAVENARIESSRKLKSLVVIESPSLPETAAYPRRIYDLVTLLVVSLIAYGIARLVIATVRDHID